MQRISEEDKKDLLKSNGHINTYTLKRLNLTNEEAYLIVNNTTKPICSNPNCKSDKSPKFVSFSKGYRKSCGDKRCKNITMMKSIKKTNLEKYGSEHYFNLEKSKETKLKRYNNENYNNPLKTKETRKKLKKEDIFKYNSSDIRNLKDLNYKYILNNFIEDKKLYKDRFMKYYNCKETFMYKKLKEFNILYLRTSSHYETSIIELIRNNSSKDFIQSDRSTIKPLELDIMIGDFAIEFDGLLSHSMGYHSFSAYNNPPNKKDYKNYHLNKTNLCEDKGIKLFHIFENEYLGNKKNIWNSMIINALGKSSKIYARKCLIKEVDNKESNKFLEDNHLQGKCQSSIRIGLYYENSLVSLMTLGKSRYDKNVEYELIRFSNIKNFTVIGGASKLLKYFERTYKPESIISYANRRFSKGELYLNLGFEFKHNSVPNYFYFRTDFHNPKKTVELESRNKYQKHKLKDILVNFDESLSETDNMIENGYRKIYDCGNKVFTKIYD